MEYRRRHDRDHPRGWLSLFARFGGGLAMLAGAALVVLTLFSASALMLADRIDRDGRHAWGAVVAKRVEGDRYLVSFAYKTSAGGQVAEAEVDAAVYDAAQVDDPHVLRYMRADPGQIALGGEDYRARGVLLRNIGLALGVMGLAMLWFGGTRANRAIKARRDGEKRFAVITAIREVPGRQDKGHLIWREEDGLTGQSLPRAMDALLEAYDAGDRIVVFRLGGYAVWEGDVGPPWREMEQTED